MEPSEVTTDIEVKKEKNDKRKELYKRLLRQNREVSSSDDNSESSTSYCAPEKAEVLVESVPVEKKVEIESQAEEDASIDEYFSNNIVKKVEISEEFTTSPCEKNGESVETNMGEPPDQSVNLKQNENEIDWTYSASQNLVTDLEYACSPFKTKKISTTKDWPGPRKKQKLEESKLPLAMTRGKRMVIDPERFIDLTDESDEKSLHKPKFVFMNSSPCDSSCDNNIDKLQRLSNLSQSMKVESNGLQESSYIHNNKPCLQPQPNRLPPQWNQYTPNIHQGVQNRNVPYYNINSHIKNPYNFHSNHGSNEQNTNRHIMSTREMNKNPISTDALKNVNQINSTTNKYRGNTNLNGTNTLNYSQKNPNYHQTYKGSAQPLHHMNQASILKAQQHVIHKNLSRIKQNARQYALGLAPTHASTLQPYNRQNGIVAPRQQPSQKSSQIMYPKTSNQNNRTVPVTYRSNQPTDSIMQNHTTKPTTQKTYSSNTVNISNKPVTAPNTTNSYAAKPTNKTYSSNTVNVSNKPTITTTTTYSQQQTNRNMLQNNNNQHQHAYNQILHNGIPTTFTNNTQNISSIRSYDNMISTSNSGTANNSSNKYNTSTTITAHQQSQSLSPVSNPLNSNSNVRGVVHNHVTVNINIPSSNLPQNVGGVNAQFQTLNRLQDFLKSLTSSSSKNA